jgi:hypothetical protein
MCVQDGPQQDNFSQSVFDDYVPLPDPEDGDEGGETDDPLTTIINNYNELMNNLGNGCTDFWNSAACMDYFSVVSQDIATLSSSASAFLTTITTYHNYGLRRRF